MASFVLSVDSQTTELRGCVEVEVAVLGSPSLTVLVVFLDIKQQ